jgi:hypothetical protein
VCVTKRNDLLGYPFIRKTLLFSLKWLAALTVNSKTATVLGTIPASSDTVESEGHQMKQY